MEQRLREKLDRILAADIPLNYECLGDCQESIVDEFEDLTIEEHDEICEIVETWWNDNEGEE